MQTLIVQSLYPQFGADNLAGIRPIGMGDAFTAVSDDENALYYNPASLSCLSRVYGTVLLNASMWQDDESRSIFGFLLKNQTKFREALDTGIIEDEQAYIGNAIRITSP